MNWLIQRAEDHSQPPQPKPGHARDDWKPVPGTPFSRMNLYSGTLSREVTNPGRISGWVLDQQGTVRVGVAFDGDAFKLLYRNPAGAAWETLVFMTLL